MAGYVEPWCVIMAGDDREGLENVPLDQEVHLLQDHTYSLAKEEHPLNRDFCNSSIEFWLSVLQMNK